jgi:hypothetical protein
VHETDVGAAARHRRLRHPPERGGSALAFGDGKHALELRIERRQVRLRGVDVDQPVVGDEIGGILHQRFVQRRDGGRRVAEVGHQDPRDVMMELPSRRQIAARVEPSPVHRDPFGRAALLHHELVDPRRQFVRRWVERSRRSKCRQRSLRIADGEEGLRRAPRQYA